MNAPDLIRKHRVFVKELQDTQEDRGLDDMVAGHHVTTHPFYTDVRSERARVLVDGVEVASEWTYIPWSPFKGISITYWVYVDVATKAEAKIYIEAAKILSVDKCRTVWIEEDPYAEPKRYHVWTKSLDDVVALAHFMMENKEVHDKKAKKGKAKKLAAKPVEKHGA